MLGEVTASRLYNFFSKNMSIVYTYYFVMKYFETVINILKTEFQFEPKSIKNCYDKKKYYSVTLPSNKYYLT